MIHEIIFNGAGISLCALTAWLFYKHANNLKAAHVGMSTVILAAAAICILIGNTERFRNIQHFFVWRHRCKNARTK